MNNWAHDELMTPTTNDDFLELGKQSVIEKSNWFNSTNWTFFQEVDGVVLEEQPMVGSNISTIKGTVVLNGSDLNKLSNNLFCSTYEITKKTYDELINSTEVLRINDNNMVTHSQFQSPFGVTNREFVSLKTRVVLENGDHLITTHSINYEPIPFSYGFVRGVVKSGILISKLNDNKLKVTKIEHVDPKGWIPSTVINMFKSKVGNRLNGMQVYT